MLKIQDAVTFPEQLPEGSVVYYHTHGRRQYYGSCKLHRDPNCRHLLKWEPGFVARGTWPKNISFSEKKKYQLAKTLMREFANSEADVEQRLRCKQCWPAFQLTK